MFNGLNYRRFNVIQKCNIVLDWNVEDSNEGAVVVQRRRDGMVVCRRIGVLACGRGAVGKGRKRLQY